MAHYRGPGVGRMALVDGGDGTVRGPASFCRSIPFQVMAGRARGRIKVILGPRPCNCRVVHRKRMIDVKY